MINLSNLEKQAIGYSKKANEYEKKGDTNKASWYNDQAARLTAAIEREEIKHK